MGKHRYLTIGGLPLGLLALGSFLILRNAQSVDPGLTTESNVGKNRSARSIVCVGLVEPEGGESDLSAQIPGVVQAIRVREGSGVEAGDILAVLDAPQERVQVALAKSRLELTQARLSKILAGPGAEEVQEVVHLKRAEESALLLAQKDLARTEKLRSHQAVSEEIWEATLQRVQTLQERVRSLQKRYEALRRGSLPEDIGIAQAEVAAARECLNQAQVLHDYRFIRAPFSGQVIRLYRHQGDSVRPEYPSPILRLAAVHKLRVRLEVSEQDVYLLHVGLEGDFRVIGSQAQSGRLIISHIVPRFGPKRLFDPDTAARVDTRILEVVCEIQDARTALYPDQRVCANFTSLGVSPP